jgi:hypothetical protein
MHTGYRKPYAPGHLFIRFWLTAKILKCSNSSPPAEATFHTKKKTRSRSKRNSRKNPADHNGDLREKNMVSEFLTDVPPANVPHTFSWEHNNRGWQSWMRQVTKWVGQAHCVNAVRCWSTTYNYCPTWKWFSSLSYTTVLSGLHSLRMWILSFRISYMHALLPVSDVTNVVIMWHMIIKAIHYAGVYFTHIFYSPSILYRNSIPTLLHSCRRCLTWCTTNFDSFCACAATYLRKSFIFGARRFVAD